MTLSREALRLHAVGGRLRRRPDADHREVPAGRSSAPIETNGDGAVNVYSRVQMFLFKARQAARAELDEQLKQHGVSIADMRAYLASKRWRGSSLFYPRHGTVGSTAANLVQHIAADVKKKAGGKILDLGKRLLRRTSAAEGTASGELSGDRSVAAAV